MKKLKARQDIPSSFRDPSGFLFYRNGSIYRQVNISYKENYDHLMNSGLYETLVDAELLIPHKEVDIEGEKPDKSYKIIQPELITFISYPYEWCFSQLKDGTLTTLEIQKKSLDFGMSLKDCSAYNIQFRKGKPILIDTLSFEKYTPGKPWVAYRQFCQHFLAPLALMSYKDIRLNQLFRIYIDGVPLDLASSLLPFSTCFRFSLLSHLHLHAKSQNHFADKTVNTSGREVTRLSFLGLIDNLESTIKKIKWRDQRSEWAHYYEDTNYSPEALQQKRQIVAEFLNTINPRSVWDLGANVGMFSRIASDKGIQTISFDIDPAAVEKNYLECMKNDETNILPLLLDLTNPSPGIGWENQERISLLERDPPDTVFALALIHHLAISNNLSLKKIADFFKKICNSLIIEFVPKSDSQVQRLLATRQDIFPDYTQGVFESEFRKYFEIENSVKIKDSERTLYLMKRRQA
ncbi:MAG: SAM-dependent methyltransferase [Candidatus Aenigmarchaeota archaeon]|nr:SAM-dependent methyltransferase [bacterium]NIO22269.1 SAM-dependent methyltransferase [Candidatus Aenigmarchaeota archaeon]